jgi:hypothetical protein
LKPRPYPPSRQSEEIAGALGVDASVRTMDVHLLSLMGDGLSPLLRRATLSPEIEEKIAEVDEAHKGCAKKHEPIAGELNDDTHCHRTERQSDVHERLV